MLHAEDSLKRAPSDKDSPRKTDTHDPATPSFDVRALKAARRIFNQTVRALRPSYLPVGKIDDAELRRQHDEISKTIWTVGSLLVGTCIFCLLTLGAPDATLVSNDAKITIPLTGTAVSYSGFLFFAPLILMGIAIYLHIFIEQRLRLGKSSTQITSPYLFNLRQASAILLSAIVFYVMPPFVLAVFAWKSLPRPDAPLFVFLTAAFTGLMILLGIRRFGGEDQAPLKVSGKMAVGMFWGLLILCVAYLALLIPPAGQIARGVLTTQFTGAVPEEAGSVRPRGKLFLMPARSLQLYGADLDKKSLSKLYAPHADMRKANLRETDLEYANLAQADLRKADLTKADLTNANLENARLEGAIFSDAVLDYADLRGVLLDATTIMNPKWRIVACALQGRLNSDCLADALTPWSDLRVGGDLRDGKLNNVDLTGADLSGTDLSKADLTNTILWLANLTNAKLPESLNGTDLGGALRTDPSSSPPAEKEMILRLWNRETNACLEGPAELENGKKPEIPEAYPCSASTEPRDRWAARRLNSAYTVFRSANPETSPLCLDSSYGEEWVHTWQCGDDYPNQWWHVHAVSSGYVTLELRDTKMCLTSPHARPSPGLMGLLFLTSCGDMANQTNQQWRIIAN